MAEERVFNLQLFGDRTEPATPKRRQQAREKGQVLQSTEVTSAALLLGAFLALRASAPAVWNNLAAFMRDTLSQLTPGEIKTSDLQQVFVGALTIAGKSLWLLLATAVGVALVVGFAQVGFVFSTQPIAFQPSRLNPAQGLQRMFSRRAAVDTLKALLKLTLIVWVAYATLSGAVEKMPGLMGMDIGGIVATVAQLAATVILRVAMVWVAIAVLDYMYQRYEYETSIRMTKQETKQEAKEQEGDPQMKARIRRRQREIAMHRMIVDVAKADVVVTNPTHYAVALQYDQQTMAAPKVVGKGQGYVAERIKQVAKDNRITTVENVPLAQGLYKTVEIGQSVPPEFYKAVAEVLAFVYRLKGRTQ